MMSATQKLVDEQNALAVHKKERRMGRQVLILRENRYNDENGKAADYAAGDILTTTNAYARVLVAAGSASFDLPVAAIAPVAEGAPEPAGALFTDVKNVSADVNTALLAMDTTWEKIAELEIKDLTKVPGLGPKTAAKLKEKAKEVLGDTSISDH